MKILIMVGGILAFFIGLYLIDKAVDTLNKQWQKKKGYDK
jgi:hypothetical protein